MEFEMIAKTFQGLEEVLVTELVNLGANNVEIQRRAVSFTGDKALLYKANIHLRTASRILKPVFHCKANDPDELYKALMTLNWSDFMSVNNTFAIEPTVYSEEFKHSKFVAYRVKDAEVERLKAESRDACFGLNDYYGSKLAATREECEFQRNAHKQAEELMLEQSNQLAAYQLHAEQLREALENRQWDDDLDETACPIGTQSCPHCDGNPKRGHDNGCAIGNALALPHSTSALDAYVAEKVKEAIAKSGIGGEFLAESIRSVEWRKFVKEV
jgi:hypothetical protein